MADMVLTVDARGDACPIPVVKTLKALGALAGPGSVETLVDNEIAVANLTRMGEGSKVVVTGDVTQIDLPAGKRSGLKHAISVLKNIEGIDIVTLTAKDVVRHPLVMAIVRAYERDGARREAAREERKKR